MAAIKRERGVEEENISKKARRESSESVASHESVAALVAAATDAIHSEDFVDGEELDIDRVTNSLAVADAETRVVKDFPNAQNADTKVKAYGKLAGQSWTYYVQRLEVIIGRRSAEGFEYVDIDLGPSRVVSRRHAIIRYNLETREWQITILGRNGIRIDRASYKNGTVTLRSGNILDIGGTQMMFVLPDSAPRVARCMLRPSQRATEGGFAVAGGSTSSSGTSSRQNSPDLDGGVGRKPHRTSSHNRTAGGGNAGGGGSGGDSKPYPRGLAIVARPQFQDTHAQYVEQDLSSDDCKDIKPPFSYATMISQAILSSPEHMMSLADIYSCISTRYAFYRHSKPGWQNSIRHNLSLNKAFEKVPRRQNEPGKGSKWQITAKYKEEFIKKASAGKHYKGRALASPSQMRPQGNFQATMTISMTAAPQPPAMASLSSAAAVAATAAANEVVHPRQSQSTNSPATLHTNLAPAGTTSAVPAGTDDDLDGPSSKLNLRSRPLSGNGSAVVPPVVPPLTSATTEQLQPGYMSEFYENGVFADGTPLRQVEAYTPERGSSFTLRGRQDSTGSGTPKHGEGSQADLQLAPPSATHNLPSHMIPGSSPAPFWKYMHLSSTPMRPQAGTGTESSPPDQLRPEELGDLPGVDLTKGFQRVGKWEGTEKA